MPTWIDDEGRLREQADDRHQFLRPIPFECLDPWTSYDSWDAELAIRLITIGYNLDIKAYWDEAKDFPHGSTGWDAARAYIDVYQRGMSIAKSSIAAGLLRNPDTPANWLAWAERKGYSVTHLKSQPAPPVPVADSASNTPAWTVTKPQRFQGYAVPLHRLLAAAYREGEPCPTARDVLEAWRSEAPAEIAKVLTDGFDYYDANGNTKTANIDAIRNAINRMTSAR